MSEFKNYVCWTDQNIKETVIPELGSMAEEDSILLDAYEVAWPLKNHSDQTEKTIKELARLVESGLDEDESNFILAIRGKSGSGKTFVVKKLHSLLPQRNDLHVIYIARSSVSIRKVVELVTRDLPGEFAERARADLEVVSVDDTNRHRCEQILLYIGQSIERVRPEGESAARRLLVEGGLGRLIRRPEILDFLARKGGALFRMAEFARSSRVDGTEIEGESVFSADDFDCEEILNVIQERTADAEEERMLTIGLLQSPVGPAVTNYRQIAAELLNEASATAVARTGGINVPLNEILDEARKELKMQGKKLVLFFEDIALAGGQEGFVYDVLRSYGKDMAPVKAIFAATDGHNVPEQILNVANGNYEVPVIDMRTAKGEIFGRTLYVRLMNLGRIGKVEALKVLRSGVDDISSACTNCAHVVACHTEFGQIGGMGLYPLNEYALKHALKRIQGVAGGVPPRDIVKFVRVDDEFIRSSSIEIAGGGFPTEILKGKIAPPSIDRAELLSTEEMKLPNRDRVWYLREMYTGVAQHSKILGAAFSIEGGSDNLIAPGDAPVLSPHPPDDTVKTWRHEGIIKWSRGGEKLSAADTQLIRRTLSELVKRRLSETDFFLNNSGQFEVMRLRDELLKDIAFGIENGFGITVNEDAKFRRNYRQIEENSLLLQAVMWLGEFKTWTNPVIRQLSGEKFQPADPIRNQGRRDLEIHIDQCAAEIRQILLADARKRASQKLSPLIERIVLDDPGIEALSAHDLTTKVINQSNEWTPQIWFGESLRNIFDSIDRQTSIAHTLSEWPISKQGDTGTVHAVDFVELVELVNEVSKDAIIWGGTEEISEMRVAVQERCAALRLILLALQQESVHYSDLLTVGGGLGKFAGEFIGLLERGARDIPHAIERTLTAKRIRDIDEQSLSHLLEKLQQSDITKLPLAEIWNIFRETPFIEEWVGILRNNRSIIDEVSSELDVKLNNDLGIDLQEVANKVNANLLRVTKLYGGVSDVNNSETE